jgi:type III secretory pathway component EscV
MESTTEVITVTTDIVTSLNYLVVGEYLIIGLLCFLLVSIVLLKVGGSY